MKLSISITTYNNEKTIVGTLNSIVENNPLKKDNYEILISDDLSQDNTVKVAEEFLENNNINYTISVNEKNNGFPGKGANENLVKAKGEFIHFIDGDDFLINSIYEELNSKEEFDILSFANINYSTKLKTFVNGDLKYETKIFVPEEFSREFQVSHAMKIIKRLFLLDNKINFPEGVSHQDDFFSEELLKSKPINYYVNKPGYIYVLNPKTLSHTVSIKEELSFYEKLLKTDENKKEERLCELIKWFLRYNITDEEIVELFYFLKDLNFDIDADVLGKENVIARELNLLAIKGQKNKFIKYSKKVNKNYIYNNYSRKENANILLMEGIYHYLWREIYNDIIPELNKKIRLKRKTPAIKIGDFYFKNANTKYIEYEDNDRNNKVIYYKKNSIDVSKYNNIEFISIDNFKKNKKKFFLVIEDTKDLDLISLSLLNDMYFPNELSEVKIFYNRTYTKFKKDSKQQKKVYEYNLPLFKNKKAYLDSLILTYDKFEKYKVIDVMKIWDCFHYVKNKGEITYKDFLKYEKWFEDNLTIGRNNENSKN